MAVRSIVLLVVFGMLGCESVRVTPGAEIRINVGDTQPIWRSQVAIRLVSTDAKAQQCKMAVEDKEQIRVVPINGIVMPPDRKRCPEIRVVEIHDDYVIITALFRK